MPPETIIDRYYNAKMPRRRLIQVGEGSSAPCLLRGGVQGDLAFEVFSWA